MITNSSKRTKEDGHPVWGQSPGLGPSWQQGYIFQQPPPSSLAQLPSDAYALLFKVPVSLGKPETLISSVLCGPQFWSQIAQLEPTLCSVQSWEARKLLWKLWDCVEERGRADFGSCWLSSAPKQHSTFILHLPAPAKGRFPLTWEAVSAWQAMCLPWGTFCSSHQGTWNTLVLPTHWLALPLITSSSLVVLG